MKGLLPWLRELLLGPTPPATRPRCLRDFCHVFALHECGSGLCAQHHILYCADFDGVYHCKKPPPQLGVVLGMRR